jgi:hypothetical protein
MHINNWIEMLEFDASISGSETPNDREGGAIASSNPGSDLTGYSG